MLGACSQHCLAAPISFSTVGAGPSGVPGGSLAAPRQAHATAAKQGWSQLLCYSSCQFTGQPCFINCPLLWKPLSDVYCIGSSALYSMPLFFAFPEPYNKFHSWGFSAPVQTASWQLESSGLCICLYPQFMATHTGHIHLYHKDKVAAEASFPLPFCSPRAHGQVKLQLLLNTLLPISNSAIARLLQSYVQSPLACHCPQGGVVTALRFVCWPWCKHLDASP